MSAVARHGLRRRIVLGLLAYVALASVAVFALGFVINEQAERALWQALLEAELDHLEDRLGKTPDYQWVDTETLALYGDAAAHAMPPELMRLPPGLHDEVAVNGRQSVVLLRETNGRRRAIALDISGLEQRETFVTLAALGAMLVMVVVLGLLIGVGADRLFRPLRELAQRIAGLRPDVAGQRLPVDEAASTEVAVIADALNDYLERNALFVERERAFIDSASHELRTPISVIAGAAELAAAQPEMPAAARRQIARIRRTSRDIERLIVLLLVLAKDPVRLADASDRIALDQLLPEIVEDHRTMAQQKGLNLMLTTLPAIEVVAPLPVVQAAIGNLLRNAIENSDSGEIVISLAADAVVEISDPGHGMSPEQISAIYARMARGGGGEGSGIGLQLIARLCAHLGWTLAFVPAPEQGTIARLDLRPRG